MTKEIEVTLHLDGDPVAKERDFYRAKLDEANARIRELEYDLAELSKSDKELKERVNQLAMTQFRKPRPRRHYVN